MCASVSRVFFTCQLGVALASSGAVSSLVEKCGRRRPPPTVGVTFDLGHVLVLAWEEPREQAVSVNEGDYLGGHGRTVRPRDRLQGGKRWVIVWRLCGCSLAGL